MQETKDLIGGLLRAVSDISNPLVLTELGVIAAAFALAWLAAYALRRVRRKPLPHAWAVSRGGLDRIVFPAFGLLLLEIGREALFRHRDAPLIDVAIPLLVSLAIIRLAFYLLRHLFTPNPLLRASERLIAWLIWVGVALHITGVLPHVTEFLRRLSVTVGKQEISVLLVLQAIFTVVVTVVLALWVARFIEARLMKAELDSSIRVMLSKTLRAILVVFAILIALPAVGIDITVLSVFGGALGVGLGLGLQKVASNYVSGFIILMDRSIRLGDMVTVADRQGVVSQLNTRYTVLTSPNGVEAIVPNELLISNTVVNHTRADKRMMLRVGLQIGHGSPLERALDIMREAAREVARVVQDPAPDALVKGFGDNGIELELVVWSTELEPEQMRLRSELYLKIWRAFQAQGIEMATPKREVRILESTRKGEG